MDTGCFSDPVGFTSLLSKVVSLPGRTYPLGRPLLMNYIVDIKLLLMETVPTIYSKEDLCILSLLKKKPAGCWHRVDVNWSLGGGGGGGACAHPGPALSFVSCG